MRRGHVYPLGSGEGVVGFNHRFPNFILRIHLTFFAGIYLCVRNLLKKSVHGFNGAGAAHKFVWQGMGSVFLNHKSIYLKGIHFSSFPLHCGISQLDFPSSTHAEQ